MKKIYLVMVLALMVPGCVKKSTLSNNAATAAANTKEKARFALVAERVTAKPLTVSGYTASEDKLALPNCKLAAALITSSSTNNPVGLKLNLSECLSAATALTIEYTVSVHYDGALYNTVELNKLLDRQNNGNPPSFGTANQELTLNYQDLKGITGLAGTTDIVEQSFLVAMRVKGKDAVSYFTIN